MIKAIKNEKLKIISYQNCDCKCYYPYNIKDDIQKTYPITYIAAIPKYIICPQCYSIIELSMR